MSKHPVPVDEQYPVDMALGDHVLRHVYEDETSADLSITVRNGQIEYRLTSNAQPINFPDDDLVQAICDVVALHERCNSGLSGAEYGYWKNPDGSWHMDAQFHYGARAAVGDGGASRSSLLLQRLEQGTRPRPPCL